MPTSRRLADLSAPEAVARLTPSSVLLQPIGAIEQHGPHLPLATDMIIAEALAEEVAAQHGDELDVWLLPPLAYSKSNEHAWAPGTIWLSAQTLLAVLDDLGRSVATLPTKRLAFFNGHGGNTQLLGMALRELRLDHGLLTFLLQPRVPPAYAAAGADTGGSELGMGIHGGHEETSLLLHLTPDLVDMAKAVRSVPEEMAERAHARFGGDVAFGWLANDLAALGHVGDPTTATAEAGAEIAAQMVQNMREGLAEIAHFAFPEQA